MLQFVSCWLLWEYWNLKDLLFLIYCGDKCNGKLFIDLVHTQLLLLTEPFFRYLTRRNTAQCYIDVNRLQNRINSFASHAHAGGSTVTIFHVMGINLMGFGTWENWFGWQMCFVIMLKQFIMLNVMMVWCTGSARSEQLVWVLWGLPHGLSYLPKRPLKPAESV